MLHHLFTDAFACGAAARERETEAERQQRDDQPCLLHLHVISLLAALQGERRPSTPERFVLDSLKTRVRLFPPPFTAPFQRLSSAFPLPFPLPLPLPFLDLSTAFPRPSTAFPRPFHCISLTFPLPFLDLPTAFPRPSHCLSSTFPLPFPDLLLACHRLQVMEGVAIDPDSFFDMVSATQFMQQIWTVLNHDGPNHLGFLLRWPSWSGRTSTTSRCSSP